MWLALIHTVGSNKQIYRNEAVVTANLAGSTICRIHLSYASVYDHDVDAECDEAVSTCIMLYIGLDFQKLSGKPRESDVIISIRSESEGPESLRS